MIGDVPFEVVTETETVCVVPSGTDAGTVAVIVVALVTEKARASVAANLTAVAGRLAVPDFYETLSAALREGGPLPVSGEEGRRAVRAWELVCQSACEGRTLQVEL